MLSSSMYIYIHVCMCCSVCYSSNGTLHVCSGGACSVLVCTYTYMYVCVVLCVTVQMVHYVCVQVVQCSVLVLCYLVPIIIQSWCGSIAIGPADHPHI